MRRAIALGWLAWAAIALAGDPAWPPSPQTQARIEELRRTLGDPFATPAGRQAAREELVRLLMHPGARAGPAIAPMPPRAAPDPAAPVARLAAPTASAAQSMTPVAPPVRAPNPIPDGRGGVVVPSGRNAVDPLTGSLLLDVGNGYLDPATGRFVPKP